MNPFLTGATAINPVLASQLVGEMPVAQLSASLQPIAEAIVAGQQFFGTDAAVNTIVDQYLQLQGMALSATGDEQAAQLASIREQLARDIVALGARWSSLTNLGLRFQTTAGAVDKAKIVLNAPAVDAGDPMFDPAQPELVEDSGLVFSDLRRPWPDELLGCHITADLDGSPITEVEAHAKYSNRFVAVDLGTGMIIGVADTEENAFDQGTKRDGFTPATQVQILRPR